MLHLTSRIALRTPKNSKEFLLREALCRNEWSIGYSVSYSTVLYSKALLFAHSLTGYYSTVRRSTVLHFFNSINATVLYCTTALDSVLTYSDFCSLLYSTVYSVTALLLFIRFRTPPIQLSAVAVSRILLEGITKHK